MTRIKHGYHALDNGEAIADASVHTGDERQQVVTHGRKRMELCNVCAPYYDDSSTYPSSLVDLGGPSPTQASSMACGCLGAPDA